MKKVTVILLIIFLVLLTGTGCVYVFAQKRLDKIERVNVEDVETIDPEQEDFEIDEELAAKIQSSEMQNVINPEDIDWGDANIQVMQDKNVVNLLLIGQDRREGQGRQRSDSMIICSINKKANKIILTSVMRDMYVPIPGYSDNRINAAYQFGGMSLLDEVLLENLGITIDGNIEVDFEGFIRALAQLGNLELELTQAEADYLNANTAWAEEAGIEAEGWHLVEGMNSMTPEQVLSYVRLRYVGNSDWERTDRQRTVLMAAFDKAMDEGISGILDMADAVLPNLITDMSNAQILGYIYTVLSSRITEIENYRIPVDGTYSCQTLSVGMEVLIPDLAKNSEYLQQYIYGM